MISMLLLCLLFSTMMWRIDLLLGALLTQFVHNVEVHLYVILYYFEVYVYC